MISSRRPGDSDAPAMLIDLDAVIESAHSLDPLPVSVGRLAALVADEDADLREIVEVITYDQALTGNLLRRANSAASAGRNPIRTVHEAVVRLGTGTVLALAMSASVSKRMGRPIPEYGLAEGQLWNHSVLATLAAETVRAASKVPVPAEVATAGLLHDVGKLVLARFLGPGVLNLLVLARDVDGLTELEAERSVLQVHHGELGGLIAQHWRLPDTIVQGITYHHDPMQALLPICFASHLANLVAETLSRPGDEPVIVSEREVAARDRSLEELGISPSAWDSLRRTVETRFEDLRERYL